MLLLVCADLTYNDEDNLNHGVLSTSTRQFQLTFPDGKIGKKSSIPEYLGIGGPG